jgi:hypothetical protein
MTLALTLALVQQTQAHVANPDDVKSSDAIIASLYSVISGPAGQKRDWNRFKSLFSPSGKMAAIAKNREGKQVLVAMSPDDYIARSGPFLEKNGFFEKEVRRKTMKVMDMVQVFSDYESRNLPEDKKPFQIGTNAIQVYSDGSRWYIHSVLWQAK